MAPRLAPTHYDTAKDTLYELDIEDLGDAARIGLAQAHAMLALCDQLESIANILAAN